MPDLLPKGWHDTVETEGWDLTEEQIGIIKNMNTHTVVMQQERRKLPYLAAVGLALLFSMTILQPDQALIEITYRTLLFGVLGFGWATFVNYGRAHAQKAELHGHLMRTEPALPGSPNYIPPEELT